MSSKPSHKMRNLLPSETLKNGKGERDRFSERGNEKVSGSEG